MPDSLALPFHRLVTPARRSALLRFVKFGAVGTLGFVWDTTTVYATAPRIGLYAAGAVAYLVASTLNWLLNRLWTFRDHAHGQAHRQWALFVLSGAGGFVLNRGTFFALVALVPLCQAYPVLAVAAGSVAGMFVNFATASRVVFRPAERHGPTAAGVGKGRFRHGPDQPEQERSQPAHGGGV